MKRNKDLTERRKKYVDTYIKEGMERGYQMKVLVLELQEILFLSERTIFDIHKGYIS